MNSSNGRKEWQPIDGHNNKQLNRGITDLTKTGRYTFPKPVIAFFPKAIEVLCLEKAGIINISARAGVNGIS